MKIIAIIASAFCGVLSMLFALSSSDMFLTAISTLTIVGTIALITSEIGT